MSGGDKQMFVIEEYRVFLENKTGFSKGKINRICYAAESLLNDFTKLLLMLIVGLCTGKVLLFVSIFLPYSVLRPFLGGLHSNSYWKCLFSAVALQLVAMSIVLFTSFGGPYTIIYAIFICIIGISNGPVSSPKKKRLNKKNKEKKKRIAMIIHIAIAVLYFVCGIEEVRNGLLAGLYLVHGQIIYLLGKEKIENGRSADCLR